MVLGTKSRTPRISMLSVSFPLPPYVEHPTLYSVLSTGVCLWLNPGLRNADLSATTERYSQSQMFIMTVSKLLSVTTVFMPSLLLETKFHYLGQVGFELKEVLLPQATSHPHHQFWDHRHVLPHLAPYRNSKSFPNPC